MAFCMPSWRTVPTLLQHQSNFQTASMRLEKFGQSAGTRIKVSAGSGSLFFRLFLVLVQPKRTNPVLTRQLLILWNKSDFFGTILTALRLLGTMSENGE